MERETGEKKYGKLRTWLKWQNLTWIASEVAPTKELISCQKSVLAPSFYLPSLHGINKYLIIYGISCTFINTVSKLKSHEWFFAILSPYRKSPSNSLNLACPDDNKANGFSFFLKKSTPHLHWAPFYFTWNVSYDTHAYSSPALAPSRTVSTDRERDHCLMHSCFQELVVMDCSNTNMGANGHLMQDHVRPHHRVL